MKEVELEETLERISQLIADFPEITDWTDLEVVDATGKMVFPSFCDSHTHIVYAASREEEFVDRINGLTYEEIAKKGGGILNSAKKLQRASEEDLFRATSFCNKTAEK